MSSTGGLTVPWSTTQPQNNIFDVSANQLTGPLNQINIGADTDWQGFKLTNLGDPTTPQDAVTNAFADITYAPIIHTHVKAAITDIPWLINGVEVSGNVTAPLTMNSNKISGLGDPTLAQDAVTKSFADATYATQSHQATHQSGNSDALTGIVDATARTTVRKNTGANVGSRRRLNFVEGTNITLTIADDAPSEEVDITINTTGLVGNHNLLDGVVHPDTVAQSPTRGSLIIGNVTPLWDELLIGGSGTFLKSDGSDPSWQSIILTDVSDVTITTSNLNSLDDGVNSTLHFHDSDRARANHTGTQLASTISDFDTQVRTNRLDQMAAPTADVSWNNNKITNLADGTSPGDAINRSQLDAAIQGLDVKESVRVTSTSNITLSGEQTIDGILTSTDRILVQGQTLGQDNGIYVTDAGAWSRSFDANTSAKVTSGLFTFVEEGTVNADNGFVLSTIDPIVLGTTPLVFSQFSGAGQITAGDGLVKSGNTIDAVGTLNRILANADSLDISPNYVGQASITTLGTITTGVWNGTDIALANIVNGTADQIIKTNAGGTALEFGVIGDANTDTFTTTKISTTSKSLLNSAIVYNDQTNTFGDFLQVFRDDKLKINSPDDVNGIIIQNSQQLADRTVSIPVLVPATGTFALLETTNVFTGINDFGNANLHIQNPGGTFDYIINSSFILADRNITLPLLSADDTFPMLGIAQTFTGANVFNGTVVFNELAGDVDYRIEGQSESNLFRTDASSDTVAIATDADLTNVDPFLVINHGSPTTAPFALTSSEGAQIVLTNEGTGNVRALYAEAENTNNSANTDAVQGLVAFANYTGSGNWSGTNLRAASYEVRMNSSATFTGNGLRAIDVRALSLQGGTPTITDLVGIRVRTPAKGPATITNIHGIEIEDQTGATNNFAIQTGLGDVEFGDVVRFAQFTTGGRPGSPATGDTIYDSTLGFNIVFDGTNWVDGVGTTV